MAALDTNLLVRFVVHDDAAQVAAAKRLVRRAVAGGQRLFVAVSVTLELEWVLRSNFAFGKAEVIAALSDLIAAEGLTFESETAIEFALVAYLQGAADFADCVHVALALQAGETPLWTFDRKASKVPGAQLLSA